MTLDPVTLSGGLQAIGSIGSSVISAISGSNNQEAMLRYNSPVNQVARLRKAGINPAFALEHGVLDAGNASSPAPPMPQFELNGLAQGVRDSYSLKIQKDIADSEIRKNNANSYAQEMDNKFSLQRNLLDLWNLRVKAQSGTKQAELLDKEIDLRQKDLESYDRRTNASVGKQEAEAAYLEAQTKYQEIVNEYEPSQREALIDQIHAHAQELRAAANAHDADAAYKVAETAVAKARKNGLDIANDQADALVDVIYQKSVAEAEKAFYDAGQSWKMSEGGKVGSLMPASDVRQKYGSSSPSPWSEGKSVPRKYRQP